MLIKVIVTAAILLAAAPSTSGAATMQAVYTGTVGNSYDQSGLFGQGAGASLDGMTYALTYTYDPTFGLRSRGPASDEVYGGAIYGAPSPMYSAVLSIGSVAQLVFGTTFSYARQLEFPGLQYLDHYAVDFAFDPWTGLVSENYAYQWAYAPAGSLPLDLDVALSLAGPAAPGQSGGAFGFCQYDPVTAEYVSCSSGSLFPESLTVSVLAPSAIPLPAGAGLLVAALGALGGLRRLRRVGP